MRIGNIEVRGRLFLAPMSNVTFLPFRLLCKRYGAAMVYSEMINADAFIMESGKTLKRSFFAEEERPIGIQLSGSSEDLLERAIRKAQDELSPDLVDINIGCPAYNVMKSGCGASLLEDPEKLGRIVKRLSKAISVPLTCKIRVTEDEEKTLEIARIIEKSGGQALTVHGRTARQMYSGKADWEIIRKIKRTLTIPVILNGDITDEFSAKTAFETTGCDAVMIGRAAIGNPHLFKRISHYLGTGSVLERQGMIDKGKDFLEFMELCKSYNYLDIASVKMQAQNFVKGFSGSNKIKERITQCSDMDAISQCLGYAMVA